MYYFETDMMSRNNIERFQKLFNQLVGVDYEVNQDDDDSYYIVITELETEEEISITNRIHSHIMADTPLFD